MAKKKTIKTSGEYGRVFAEIRKSKGYSQHEVEDSTVTAATISRFERGDTMIGTDSFLKILGNIGVTSSEFEAVFQKLSNRHDPLPLQNVWALVKATELQSVSMIESLLTEIKKEIKNNPNLKKYQLDRILVQTTLSRLDDSNKVSPKNLKFLTDFLLKTKRWGRYETFLLGWTTILFDTETLEQLFKHMLESNDYTNLYYRDKKFIIDTALNILDNFLVKNELMAAKNVILQLENYEINTQLLFERMELKYDKARFNFLSGIKPKLAIKEMWYYYDVLKYAESFELANVVRDEIMELNSRKKSIKK
ncbi:Rgg/GadR/MutR family transcriptional regulator [Lactovum odontotermitis]